MKFYASIATILYLIILQSCDKQTSSNCQEITVNETFTAKINETWCIDEADWEITFGPLIEDSRCNVPGIQCIWAGRFVIGATIKDNGETLQDTFFAEFNWTDTLYQGPYKIIMSKVYPEERTSMEALESSAYSFDITVKQ